MTTKELIEKVKECKKLRYFTRINGQICYQLPYELFDEIIKGLEELEELRTTKKANEDKAYMDYLLEKRQGRV